MDPGEPVGGPGDVEPLDEGPGDPADPDAGTDPGGGDNWLLGTGGIEGEAMSGNDGNGGGLAVGNGGGLAVGRGGNVGRGGSVGSGRLGSGRLGVGTGTGGSVGTARVGSATGRLGPGESCSGRAPETGTAMNAISTRQKSDARTANLFELTCRPPICPQGGHERYGGANRRGL